MLVSRHVRGALLVGAVVALTSACGSDSDADSVELPKFTENIAQWSTPLDAYVSSPADQSYARKLVYGHCLREAGYAPPVAAPPGSFIPPVFNANVRRLFNVKIAREFGYHTGKPEVLTADEKPASGDAERAARSKCAQTANDELDLAVSASDLVYGLKSSAYQEAMVSAPVVAAAQRWHTCMLPLGLPDLPQEFEDGVMPTDSQRRRFGMDSAEVDGGRPSSYVPTTTAEVREAVFDAKCRDSSGLSTTLYGEEVANQLDAISANREKLGQAFLAGQEEQNSIERIVKKYAG